MTHPEAALLCVLVLDVLDCSMQRVQFWEPPSDTLSTGSCLSNQRKRLPIITLSKRQMSKQPFNSLIPEAKIIAFRFRLLSESGESERGRNRIGKFCKSNHALNLTRLPNERQMSILQCTMCTKPKLCSMLTQAAVLWSNLGCRNVQTHETRPTDEKFDAHNKTGLMRPPSYSASIDSRLPTRVFEPH